MVAVKQYPPGCEPCTPTRVWYVGKQGGLLTIAAPSGNRYRFERTSQPSKVIRLKRDLEFFRQRADFKVE